MKEEPSKDKASDHDGAIENYVGTQPQVSYTSNKLFIYLIYEPQS